MIKNNWISVEDRWPDTAGDYIVYGRFTRDCPKGVDVGSFYKKRRRFYNRGIITKDVTHWMPLPEPPNQPQDANQ